MAELRGIRDRYGGLTVTPAAVARAVDGFAERLEGALAGWRGEGVRLVWLPVSRELSTLVPTAIRLGFEFHHCTSSQLVLVHRLDREAPVPPYASHSIGAGALVVSAQAELLVVLERCDERTRPDHWKLPGGMLDHREHIAAGVVREVREETGIEARFEELLGCRHHHVGPFGTSNLYVVCRLSPLSHEIRIDPVEIAAARWMPIREYVELEEIGELNRRMAAAVLDRSGLAAVELDGYMGGAHEYEVFVPKSPAWSKGRP